VLLAKAGRNLYWSWKLNPDLSDPTFIESENRRVLWVGRDL